MFYKFCSEQIFSSYKVNNVRLKSKQKLGLLAVFKSQYLLKTNP